MQGIGITSSEILNADSYVFACGPWLGKVFPILAPSITPTRQEVLFFGTAAGDLRFTEAELPLWIDGRRRFYGIPGNHWRGFKIADDARGPAIDPTTMERRVSDEALTEARTYLRLRFPGLAGAPLVEGRVCQYENSPDQNFILDRHPEAENVWIVGGGSGHCIFQSCQAFLFFFSYSFVMQSIWIARRVLKPPAISPAAHSAMTRLYSSTVLPVLAAS